MCVLHHYNVLFYEFIGIYFAYAKPACVHSILYFWEINFIETHCIIKCIHFQCTVEWILINIQSHETTVKIADTSITTRSFLIILCSLSSHPEGQGLQFFFWKWYGIFGKFLFYFNFILSFLFRSMCHSFEGKFCVVGLGLWFVFFHMNICCSCNYYWKDYYFFFLRTLSTFSCVGLFLDSNYFSFSYLSISIVSAMCSWVCKCRERQNSSNEVTHSCWKWCKILWFH